MSGYINNVPIHINIDSKAIFSIRNQALTFQNNQQKDLSNPWTMAGPVNIGGRITDIQISPSDTNTYSK